MVEEAIEVVEKLGVQVEKLWFLGNTMAIGTIMKCWHSSLTNMQNMQHKRNSSIQDCKWYLLHNDGTKLLKSYKEQMECAQFRLQKIGRLSQRYWKSYQFLGIIFWREKKVPFTSSFQSRMLRCHWGISKWEGY